MFTSAEVMAAESSLLRRAGDDTAPRVALMTLGPEPQSDVQRADAAKARRALGIARRLADQAQGIDGPQPSVPAAGRNLNRP